MEISAWFFVDSVIKGLHYVSCIRKLMPIGADPYRNYPYPAVLSTFFVFRVLRRTFSSSVAACFYVGPFCPPRLRCCCCLSADRRAGPHFQPTFRAAPPQSQLRSHHPLRRKKRIYTKVLIGRESVQDLYTTHITPSTHAIIIMIMTLLSSCDRCQGNALRIHQASESEQQRKSIS